MQFFEIIHSVMGVDVICKCFKLSILKCFENRLRNHVEISMHVENAKLIAKLSPFLPILCIIALTKVKKYYS